MENTLKTFVPIESKNSYSSSAEQVQLFYFYTTEDSSLIYSVVMRIMEGFVQLCTIRSTTRRQKKFLQNIKYENLVKPLVKK